MACPTCGSEACRGCLVAADPFAAVTKIPVVVTAARWRSLLGLFILGLFLAAVVAGFFPGFRSRVGDLLGRDQLSVGQCFVGAPNSLQSLPCDSEHQGEVVGIIEVTGEDSYPGRDVLDYRASEACPLKLASYTGETNDSVDLVWAMPTSDSWGEGDRSIWCLALVPEGLNTSSLKRASG